MRQNLQKQILFSFEQYSNSIAINDGNNFLSYKELFEKVKLDIQRLKDSGITAGKRIIIIGEKSVSILSMMFACLLSDIVYIPLEKPMPKKRVEQIIRETAAHYIFDSEIGIKSLENSDNRNNDDILMFYTSGTSGLPKAVRITAINMIMFVEWASKEFNITKSDRIAAIAPWHFDLSIFDIFVSLFNGCTLFFLPNSYKPFPSHMAAWIIRNAITVLYCVPTMLRQLERSSYWENKDSHKLRVVLFAGEVYPLNELKKLRGRFPNVVLANLYGPTETNVCTWKLIPPLKELQNWQTVPIGEACPGFTIYCLSDKKLIAEVGSEGEIVCVGNGVSPGYFNDPYAKQFFHYKGQNAYLTGDLGKITEQGIEFFGRKDSQIKFQGFRIDIHEIEACLRQQPSIIDAAVVVTHETIIAFIVANELVLKSVIAQHCLSILPNYCCPREYYFLQHIPKTLSDKINYQSLLQQVCHNENA